MKIETKYNIGDKLYFVNLFKEFNLLEILDFYVKSIKIYNLSGKLIIEYSDTLGETDSSYIVSERDCFINLKDAKNEYKRVKNEQ